MPRRKQSARAQTGASRRGAMTFLFSNPSSYVRMCRDLGHDPYCPPSPHTIENTTLFVEQHQKNIKKTNRIKAEAKPSQAAQPQTVMPQPQPLMHAPKPKRLLAGQGVTLSSATNSLPLTHSDIDEMLKNVSDTPFQKRLSYSLD